MPTRKPRRKELGLSVDDYDRLLDLQGGGCAVCGRKPKTRRLDVDHDHRTGQVRGLLCHLCNRALPTWVSVTWLEQARAYLLAPPAIAAYDRGVGTPCRYCGNPSADGVCRAHADLVEPHDAL